MFGEQRERQINYSEYESGIFTDAESLPSWIPRRAALHLERTGKSLDESIGIELNSISSKLEDGGLMKGCDFGYASDLFSRICNLQDPYRKLQGLLSLNFLLPGRNSDRTRQIGDRKITPGLEKRWESRLTADEVDGKELGWRALPEPVRNRILKHKNPVIQLVNNCTCGCKYCGVSKQYGGGLIDQKLGYELSLDVAQSFVDEKTEKSIDLYDHSDPFDAKWVRDGEVLIMVNWLRDIEQSAVGIAKKGSFFNVSTSVPLGEELNVLKVVEYMCSNEQKPVEIFLRFSVNDQNTERIQALSDLAECLHTTFQQNSNVIFEHRNGSPTSIMGQRLKWVSQERFRWEDFVGINGRGSRVTIRPGGIFNTSHVAICPENPTGQVDTPVISGSDGQKRYSVIKESGFVYPGIYGIVPLGRMLPPLSFDNFEINEDGDLTRYPKVMPDSPGRSLLRIALAILHVGSNDRFDDVYNLSLEQKHKIAALINPADVRNVLDHLFAQKDQGSMDPYMQKAMSVLANNEILDEVGVKRVVDLLGVRDLWPPRLIESIKRWLIRISY